MTSSKRFLTRLVIVTVLISAVPVGASAGPDGDQSFSSVVKHIKSNYRAKQQGFLGFVNLARFVVKVIRPAGVKNFKVTMLRDLDYSHAAKPETPEFHSAIEDKIQSMWSPLIRFSSAREKQWTYVYVTQEKKDVKILAVAVQEQLAFVFQMKFSPEKLSAFISDPKIMGISIGDEKRSAQPAPALADPAPDHSVADHEEKSSKAKPPDSSR
ncbi:MAG TPA: hypothetical protein VLE20_09415 [Blastocatellia bacterium]|nr:hypothetical protein [Blastocatellia bacterium]